MIKIFSNCDRDILEEDVNNFTKDKNVSDITFMPVISQSYVIYTICIKYENKTEDYKYNEIDCKDDKTNYNEVATQKLIDDIRRHMCLG